jgi:hypothetical protein
LIRARTSEGRERAKARGVKRGRKPKLTERQKREAIRRRDKLGEPVREIARLQRQPQQRLRGLRPDPDFVFNRAKQRRNGRSNLQRQVVPETVGINYPRRCFLLASAASILPRFGRAFRMSVMRLLTCRPETRKNTRY